MTAPLSRKEISQLTRNKLSVWQIRRHEAELGLDRVKIPLRTRAVLYRRQAALIILKNSGLLE